MNRSPLYMPPERPAPGRRHAFAARIAAMLVGFAVLAPVAAAVGNGDAPAVVEAGALPGATLEAIAVRGASSTTSAPPTSPRPTSPRPTSAPVVATPQAVAPAGSSQQVGVTATKPRANKAAAKKAAASKPAAAKKNEPAAAKKAAAKQAAAKKAAAKNAAAKQAAAASAVKKAADASSATKAAAKKTAAKAAAAPAPTTVVAAKQPAPATTAKPAVARASWTPAQVEQVIRDIWPDELEDRAIAIAKRESKLIPTSHNWCCHGVFAIYFKAGKRLLNSIGITSIEQLYDPVTNTRAAYAIYQAAGWDPWKL